MGPEKGLQNVRRTSGWYLAPEKGLQSGKKDFRMVLSSGKRTSGLGKRTSEPGKYLREKDFRARIPLPPTLHVKRTSG